MQISPIPTLSDEINDIRTRTANIVAEKIIPNEKEIYSKSENSSSVRKEIRDEVKKEKLWAPHLPEEYGGMGIGFMKQYAQSGIEIPVVGPAFSFDQGILKAVGDAALGVKNTSQWSKDLDNKANKKFVSDFQNEYGRLPSLYASQGYDTGMLLLSAMAKASVNDMEAFRDALRSADFDSTRGQFRFSSNHHPIQDIYVREVIKEGDTLTNKIVSVGLQDHSNAYVDQCSM